VLTQKQELFCQEMLKADQRCSDAYRKVYNVKSGTKDATVHRCAHELIENPKVAARIKELRNSAASAAVLSLDQHMADLEALREEARQAGQFSAAINAEISRGKARGFYVAKVEDVTDPLKKAMGNMTPEKAMAMLDALDRVQTIREKAKAS
jgi:hypothetical protein